MTYEKFCQLRDFRAPGAEVPMYTEAAAFALAVPDEDLANGIEEIREQLGVHPDANSIDHILEAIEMLQNHVAAYPVVRAAAPVGNESEFSFHPPRAFLKAEDWDVKTKQPKKRAAIAQSQPVAQAAVPDGWKLVPANTTEDLGVVLDMGFAYLEAARADQPCKAWAFSHAGYLALVAAAPQAPQPQAMPLTDEEIHKISLQSALYVFERMDRRVAQRVLHRFAHAIIAAISPQPQAVNEATREAVCTAVAEALGGALDCTRAWSAWGIGTMHEDDFAELANDPERVAEIADAAIAAMAAREAK